MTFKVILTYPSIDDDEHTYYGMVFLKNGQSQLKRLNVVEDHKKKAVFTFDGSPVANNENYLAILLPVNESETIRKPCFKIQFNDPAPVPEIVDFPENCYV